MNYYSMLFIQMTLPRVSMTLGLSLHISTSTAAVLGMFSSLQPCFHLLRQREPFSVCAFVRSFLSFPLTSLSEMKNFYAAENDLEFLSLLPQNAMIPSTIPGLSGTEAQTENFMHVGQALLSTESHPQPLALRGGCRLSFLQTNV